MNAKGDLQHRTLVELLFTAVALVFLIILFAQLWDIFIAKQKTTQERAFSFLAEDLKKMPVSTQLSYPFSLESGYLIFGFSKDRATATCSHPKLDAPLTLYRPFSCSNDACLCLCAIDEYDGRFGCKDRSGLCFDDFGSIAQFKGSPHTEWSCDLPVLFGSDKPQIIGISRISDDTIKLCSGACT